MSTTMGKTTKGATGTVVRIEEASASGPAALFIRFPHTTQMDEIEDIEHNGRRFVPFLGNRVTPELAARRALLRDLWGEAGKTSGLTVEFRLADSIAVAALGRVAVTSTTVRA